MKKRSLLLFFISAVPEQGSVLVPIRIIKLIKGVLKALNPQPDRHSKYFGGRGASIFWGGASILGGGVLVFCYRAWQVLVGFDTLVQSQATAYIVYELIPILICPISPTGRVEL